jgi:hypothetical protein
LDLTTLATRQVNTGVEEYPTVSAGSGATRRTLVATVSNPKGALFTMPISDAVNPESAVQRVELPVAHAVSPRFGPGYILYLSSRHGPHGLWKLADGTVTELWRGDDGGVIGPRPAPTAVASLSVHKQGRTSCMPREDGSICAARKRVDVLDAGAYPRRQVACRHRPRPKVAGFGRADDQRMCLTEPCLRRQSPTERF